MHKMKKTTGEILDCNEISEKNPGYVKNFGIWIKYNSRSGTHNMYREYRDTNLNNAIDTLYNDMAGRHRTRSRSIQIIKTAAVTGKDKLKRASTLQLIDSKIKFPLPHRILRPSSKAVKSVFSSIKPNTHYQ
jgi:large subunit ribosomal protein L18Ae